MPEQFEYPRSKYQGEKEKDKEIAKLARKITDTVPHKIKGITTEDAEYWALREVITHEMAVLANKMKLRRFYTFEELHKMNPQYSEEELRKLLYEISYIGLFEYDYGDNYDHYGELKDRPRIQRWRIPYFVPGAAELFNSSKERVDKNPPVATAFERMTFEPLAGITQMVPPGGDGIGMHVIPVEKAVDYENEAVDLERISYWLKKYEGHLSAGICSCRYSRATCGEGCGDDPESWCIQVGDMADYAVETKRAHYITKEEALDILQKAEDNGFVHQITNIDGENKIFDICNCDVKICNALRTSLLFNTPNMSKSAYTARTTPENCVACGLCVESCPAGAVKLGQKLCLKDGSEQEYPQSILPDNIHWGKYAWDENYRDTARLHNTWPTGSAPCKAACPAHVPVQAYLKKANEGEYDDALELIKKNLPFPAVCGRVCNRRCEDACTRGTVDEAIAIDEVKRFIAERDLHAETRFVPKKVIPKVDGEFDEKIAIIGGGPAGLSCAYYLALTGYRPTVFEREEKMGGMMTYGIPKFRLEKDLVLAEIDILKELGVEFKNGVEIGKDVTIQQLRDEGYKAFYIAIGLQTGGKLGVPGDDASGVIPGIDFMRKVNTNTNDEENAHLLSGRVVVIGGGNIASDVARTAVRCGADSVAMYCLEAYEDMPCGEEDRTECEQEGIEIHAGWGQTEVRSENGACTGIVFRKCLSVKDEQGRFAPKFDDSEIAEESCTTVLFCIGQKTAWKDLLNGTGVTLSKRGLAEANAFTYQTGEPDIFVGGDAYTGQKFVIDAVAAGHYAAESLHRYVRPNASMTIGRDRHDYKELDKENIRVEDYEDISRQKPAPCKDMMDPFRDHRGVLTEEQVKAETSRCLSCGRSVVDPHKCIGCGICTTRCKFDAIHLYRDHPQNTDMRFAENKVGGLMRYQIPRMFRIIAHSGSDEAKLMRRKRKLYKEIYGEYSKTHPYTGNAVREDEENK